MRSKSTAPRASEASGAHKSGRGGLNKDPLRGSPHAVEGYGRTGERSERRTQKRPRGAKEGPPPGVTTCGRRLRPRAHKSGRGGLKKDPPPGVTTCGRSLRPPERAKRAAHTKAAAGAKKGPPSGGHHMRSKSTAPRASEASGADKSGRGGLNKDPLRGSPHAVEVYGTPSERSERRTQKRPRGAKQGPPPGVTTCGRS